MVRSAEIIFHTGTMWSRGGYYPPAITNIKTQQARKGPAKNSQKPVEVGSEGKESAERKTV